MRGNITKRGTKSWRLKFDVGADPLTGKRKYALITVRGTYKQAQQELTRQLAAYHDGTFFEPTKVRLAEWLDQWLADQHGLAAKTAERYSQLISAQITPHLGACLMQKLRPTQIKAWHGALLKGGGKKGRPLAARTVGHAHRVLSKALGDAVGLEMLARNVAAAVPPPKIEAKEMEILSAREIADLMTKLRGRTLYPVAVVALGTGMRRGELLALRWSDVDLDAAKLRVERSLEQTKAGGLRFKAPKTKHGRRTITLPGGAVDVLRDHRRQQLEWRFAHGLGKLADDALVFARPDGDPRSPHALTQDWRHLIASLGGLPHVTFHALRHSHASALIAANVDVLTISRRLGHGSASITLGVYGHLFSDTDNRAASAIDAALGELR